MKYIRVKKLENARDCFIIFPKHVTHLGMSRQMGYDHVGIISAGFVSFDVDGPTCYGESIGLRTKSRPGDTELLRKQVALDPVM